MFRSTTIGVLIGSLLLAAGCDQSPPPASDTPSTPPVSTLPQSSAPGTNAQTAPAPTPHVPATPAPAAPGTVAGAASSLTLEAAFEGVARPSRRLCELFDSVQDDASAMAAAPQITQAGVEFAAGMKQFKSVVAALLLAGQNEQVSQFIQKQAEKGELPEANLMDKLKRVVNSPRGPLLRNEINGLLDGMLEAGTSGDRRNLQRLIEREKLRR